MPVNRCRECQTEYPANGHRPNSAHCLHRQISNLEDQLRFLRAECDGLRVELTMARGCLERLRECYTEDLRHQQGLIDKLEEIVKLVPK